METQSFPTRDSTNPPKESSGSVWTSYADSYFESDFASPFSDLEEAEEDEEEEGEDVTTSSGNSESASLEDNPLVTEDQPLVENSGLIVQSEKEGQLTDSNVAEEQSLLSKSVDSESPLSASSGDSPEHTSSRESQVER